MLRLRLTFASSRLDVRPLLELPNLVYLSTTFSSKNWQSKLTAIAFYHRSSIKHIKTALNAFFIESCRLHQIYSFWSNLLLFPLLWTDLIRSFTDQIWSNSTKEGKKKNLLVSYLQPKNQKICCLLYVAKDVLLSWCRCITWRLCDLMEVVFWMKKVIFLKSSDEEAFRVKL